jgi:sulfide:quinone oxidoreductase
LRPAAGEAVPARVLIAGAGVAALEAALALRALAPRHVQVELLGAELHFWFRPLSVLQPFDEGEATRYQLPALAAAAGVEYNTGALSGVDAARRLALTSVGDLPYDFLVLAVGATPVPVVPGAITFRGPADTDEIRRLLRELLAGEVRRVAFASPAGPTWSLPLYELALHTAAQVERAGLRAVELTLVTPEAAPLQLYGRRSSLEVANALEQRGVGLRTGRTPVEFRDGVLRLEPDAVLEVDRVVALPRLRGAPFEGVPQTPDGFVPVDAEAAIRGLGSEYAAGDIVDFPVKHGGVAAQLADVAASSIAARAGAAVRPELFRARLEGVLLGDEPHVLPPGRPGAGAAKLSARYLTPFLERLSLDAAASSPACGQW